MVGLRWGGVVAGLTWDVMGMVQLLASVVGKVAMGVRIDGNDAWCAGMRV